MAKVFEEKDDERIEFVVLRNSVPIHIHTSKNLETTLRKYYQIAHNKPELDDNDELILSKKAKNLYKRGKTKIKKFLFLKINNINLDQLADKN